MVLYKHPCLSKWPSRHVPRGKPSQPIRLIVVSRIAARHEDVSAIDGHGAVAAYPRLLQLRRQRSALPPLPCLEIKDLSTEGTVASIYAANHPKVTIFIQHRCCSVAFVQHAFTCAPEITTLVSDELYGAVKNQTTYCHFSG